MSNYIKPNVTKRFEENDENLIIDENRKNINYKNVSNKLYNNKKLNKKLEIKQTSTNESKSYKKLSNNTTKLLEGINETNLHSQEKESESQNEENDTELKIKNQMENKKEEIKEIANLCLEKNLAITNENIQIIRKLKERRMLEEQINKNANIKNLEEKRIILEEIEFHEWADREKRIKELQEKKMKLLKKVIEQRNSEKADKIFYEVEKIIQKRDENKDKIIENFEKEKARDMRNLFTEKKYNLKTIFNQKNDIVDDMTNYTSNYNLQLERNGITPSKISNRISNKIDNLLNVNSLNQLDITFDKQFNCMYNKNKDHIFNKREDKKNKQLIDTFHRYLNKDETKYTTTNEYMVTDYQKTKKKTQCMKINFPEICVKTNEEKDFEKNVIYLQNMLRGKAIKKLMKDGINAYSDLIDELKTYEKIDQYSIKEKELLEKENFKTITIDSYIENLQGKYVSELLDKLSNELEKYEEERKIDVLVKYAERERRLKECKEKGKRQAEILLREKEDYLFNEIMGLNNQTVDSYLEDILSKTINDVSKKEALIRSKEKADQLNNIYKSLESNKEEQNKLIVKDLVGNFIIPYVDKMRGIEFEQLEQKKNNYASYFATKHVFSKISEAI